ncbi:hypothetical protein CGCF415_v015158 [Colletotrichum fructicola]|uniref:Uncharacterized protein n=4 Tax=Colletotrichum gloeosporioides species complex TaxID=2707338 RepID=A0A8H3W9F0_9PEZI|nr:uncharacterized protein CGMCC3_g12306 [Colletotrichum fructicola]XP_036499467.1 uncharacterized protein CGCS363_v003319 [Colletotrichum siamense]XP_037182497.1 uncharacterized protein CGCA056_v002658 [Colletotrichum aenigma]XP_053029383.1 uncharacterized protein COL26b_014093 [Colletotrichum chrysophilum]KAF0324811.1 hypothetical protein GQ607_007982 [Colletotrichum asianum]KAK2756057.1 hypothetical protein CKAH01_17190 [Colletotrichum kahawae]KAE9571663.1 hypothetical protein CGMCC3_g1230
MQISNFLFLAVFGLATTVVAQQGTCTAKGECQAGNVKLFCTSGSCAKKEGQTCERSGNSANCPK